MNNKLPFTISPRLLVDKTANIEGVNEVFKTWTLTEIRDFLWKMRQKAQPRDVDLHLRNLQVDFTGGVMRVKCDAFSKPVRLLTMGASHLQGEVLPGYFWSGFKVLAKLDPDLAQQVWMRFAQETERPRRIRTTLIKEGREIHRVVRAMVSKKYTRYAHINFVQDILDTSDHFSTLPVLSWTISDRGMRIRFLGIDEYTELMSALDSDLLMKSPLPCVEIWNSETRQGEVGCAAGAYLLRTQSGFGHWDGRAAQGWAHRGSTTRMVDRVQTAFPMMTKHAADVVEAYSRACQVGMDDPKAWLLEQLGNSKEIPQRVLEAAIGALESDKVTQGKKLATIIDALSLATAKENNIFTRKNIERATARILRLGTDIARQNGGVIPSGDGAQEEK